MILLRPAWMTGLLLAAGAAAAQDPRSLVVGGVRLNGCAMAEEEAGPFFAAMGLPWETVGAVAQELVATGGASLTAEGSLVLSEGLCRPAPAAWIEEGLAAFPGCRAPLRDFEAEMESLGLAAEAFDAGLLELASTSRVVPEGTDIVLADCPPGVDLRPDPLARIESFGMPGLRGLVALHLSANGCRVTPAGREETVAEMVAEAASQMALGDPLPQEATAALRTRIEEVLDNPGPAYEIDPGTGDLVLLHCTP